MAFAFDGVTFSWLVASHAVSRVASHAVSRTAYHAVSYRISCCVSYRISCCTWLVPASHGVSRAAFHVVSYHLSCHTSCPQSPLTDSRLSSIGAHRSRRYSILCRLYGLSCVYFTVYVSLSCRGWLCSAAPCCRSCWSWRDGEHRWLNWWMRAIPVTVRWWRRLGLPTLSTAYIAGYVW